MLTIARPLGCCWTISQGVLHLLTSYALEVLLDYLRGVLHMLTTPWGAVGLPQVCAVHTHLRINYACALITHAHIIIRQWQLLCEVRRLKPTVHQNSFESFIMA